MRCRFKFTGDVVPIVLNDKLGGASLIRSLTISSLATNTVLEQIDNYNQLAYVKSHFENNQSMTNKNALVSGNGSGHSGPQFNLFWSTEDELTTNGLYKLGAYKEVELLIPLSLSGVLGQGRNPKVVPVVAMGGLRISIILEHDVNKITQAVQFRGDGKLNELVGFDPRTQYTAASIYTNGSTFDLTGTAITLNNVADGADEGLAFDSLAELRAAFPIYKSDKIQVIIEDKSNQVITVSASDSYITKIEMDGPRVKLTLNDDIAGAGTVPEASRVALYIAGSTPNYQISNVELVTASVQAPATYINSLMGAVKRGLNYDYTTFTNYQVNLNSSITQSSQYIPMSQSRCLSLLSVPETIAAVDTYSLIKDGLRPTIPETDVCSPENYNYLIKNLRTPLQSVELTRLSETTDGADDSYAKFAAVHTKETEEAIEACDIAVRNLDRPNHCFIIARALARHGHSFNAQGVGETRLNLRYNSNTKNQIFNHFVCHRRRAVIKSNSLVVEV
tara:strand:- start:85 stop:1599 length:1515 start_codon:yes stop_codon:yes gene_type:complete